MTLPRPVRTGVFGPRRVAPLLAAGMLAAFATGCQPVDSFNPVTPQGASIANLFWLAMILAVLVSLAVGVAVIYAAYRFRARPGAGEPRQVHGNTKLEIGWTAAPFLLLVFLFILVLRTMSAVEAEAASPLRVRVVAHQWWWEYEYQELGFITANELHVPVGQPVRLELTSADVVHNFWVPRVGWKKDNTPGMTTAMTFVVDQPGVYDGACTEFCGVQHAWMRIRIVAEATDQFGAWAARQQQPAAAAVPRGQQVFLENTCVSCHAIQGIPATARVGPDLSHFGSRTTIGAGVVDNTPENLRDWIVAPHRIKPGVLMPGYPDLSEEDLRALVEYLEGLK